MITLIGNNKSNTHDYSGVIDKSSLVVRMNKCLGYNSLYGSKTDIWSVVSDVPSITGMISKRPHYEQIKQTVDEVWLVRLKGYTSKPERTDTPEAFVKIHNLENFQYYPEGLWKEVNNILRPMARNYQAPSTGFLTLFKLMKLYPKDKITLIGFTGHACGTHPMRVEKHFINKWIREGRVQKR